MQRKKNELPILTDGDMSTNENIQEMMDGYSFRSFKLEEAFFHVEEENDFIRDMLEIGFYVFFTDVENEEYIRFIRTDSTLGKLYKLFAEITPEADTKLINLHTILKKLYYLIRDLRASDSQEKPDKGEKGERYD